MYDIKLCNVLKILIISLQYVTKLHKTKISKNISNTNKKIKKYF